MDPYQVRQALQEVRHLRRNILEKQLFRGYSGRARALGGLIALLAGLLGQTLLAGGGDRALFLLWGSVFALAFAANYGAVLAWLSRQPKHRRTEVSFVMEVVPVWIVGGILTLALWHQGAVDLLYGSWMSLFGLAQCIGRTRLPRLVGWIGLYYIICGGMCLLFAEGLFQRPVLMGLVFFCGELGSGLIMHTADRPGGLAAWLNWRKQHGR